MGGTQRAVDMGLVLIDNKLGRGVPCSTLTFHQLSLSLVVGENNPIAINRAEFVTATEQSLIDKAQ